MRLSQADYDNSQTGCCARLDEDRWDGRRLEWHEKPFLRDQVRAFLHVPLNFGSVMSRDHKAIEAAEAYPKDPIWLTENVSPWQSDIYVAIDRAIPGVEIDRLSGTFLTKVFEGPYRKARAWTREMNRYAKSQGYRSKKTYFYYSTCPKCAKSYGQNLVVLFAKAERL